MLRAFLLVLLASAPPVQDWKEQKPVSLRKWVLQAQEIASKYGRGVTNAETDRNSEAFVKEFSEKMDGTVIEFKTQVTDVRWEDGFALVTTKNEIPLSKAELKVAPLDISRAPLQFEMQRDEALSIKKGDWLTFKGKLKFERGLIPAAKGKSQEVYRVKHLRFVTLDGRGMFTTTEYECTIDGKDVVERWSK